MVDGPSCFLPPFCNVIDPRQRATDPPPPHPPTKAAGPDLYEACRAVPEVRRGVRCPTGEARITPGFDLPASFVIHTVGPVYKSDRESESLLRAAHRSCLELADREGVGSIAFPALSCGVYGAWGMVYVSCVLCVQPTTEMGVGGGERDGMGEADCAFLFLRPCAGYPVNKAAHVAVSECIAFSQNAGNASRLKEIDFVLFSQDVYRHWISSAEELLPVAREGSEGGPSAGAAAAAKQVGSSAIPVACAS